MNRRKFLRNSALLSAPMFLKGLPVFAGNDLTHPWLNSLARNANNCNRILVIIQLNGGNDGLNMVIPIDKWAELTAARGGTNGMLIPQSSVLSLNNIGSSGTNTTTGLHPSMTGLQSLYNNGKVALMQGVSYNNPSYSHFQAQDIFFSSPATSATTLDTGWVGRTMDTTYPGFPAGYPTPTVQDPLAIQIGGALPLSLQGPNINMGYNVPDPANLIQVATATTAAAPVTDYGTELTFLRQMQNQGNAYTTRITAAWNGYNASNQSSKYPATGANKLADQLKTVAHLIGGGLTTQVYIVNHPDSFDTHVNQVAGTTAATLITGTHANNLSKLSVAIDAFMDDLGIMGKQNMVTGMTFSEFGRRVVQNTSYGTDHGAAAPVIMFGGALNGGVYGTSPNLPTAPNGNTQVPLQYDFRQLYATILQKWMCMTAANTQSILNTTTATNTPITGLFNSVVLPVETIDLSASWTGNAAQIDFLVHNNDRYDTFIIERSADGKTFSNVGVVKRVDSTEDAHPYRFSEARVSFPKVFYRVRGMLQNGEARYSSVAELTNGARSQALSIYPNPVTNYTIHMDFLEAVNELVEVELYDMMSNRVFYNSMIPDAGRLVFRVPYGLGTYTPYIIRVRWSGTDVREQISFI